MKSKLLLMLFMFPVIIFAAFDLHLEGGAVFCGYNDIKIPGDTGTEYSFCDDLDYTTQTFARVHLGYRINPRHYIFLTAAPFTVEAEGELDNDLYFDNMLFYAGNKLTSTYNFNSWRVTWRYTLLNNNMWDIGAGFTAKIRDAYISVEDSSKKATFSNVGFVPIINFLVQYNINSNYAVSLEGDGLGAPQGRAVDMRFAVEYKVSEKYGIDIGYRVLEGGADNDKIYGFALFHYLSIGINWDF